MNIDGFKLEFIRFFPSRSDGATLDATLLATVEQGRWRNIVVKLNVSNESRSIKFESYALLSGVDFIVVVIERPID